MSGCAAHVAAQSVLERHDNGAHLTVNGQPMLILGGELSNSAATCFDDIDRVMPEMKRLGLNTVLVPAQWDLIEPREGEYDFSLIGRAIDKARENQLKVVFLWFGAWKNSMSLLRAPLVQGGCQALSARRNGHGQADGNSQRVLQKRARGRPPRILQRR